MKKIVSLLLSVSLLLAGCSSVPLTTEENVSSKDEVNATETEEITTTLEEKKPDRGSSNNDNEITISSSESIETTVSETSSNFDNSESSTVPDYQNPELDTSKFTSLSCSDLREYVVDNVYANLEEQLPDDVQVEDVSAVYVSDEYLEELAYNSQKNIYFGYTLDEVESQFGDTPVVFTLGDDGTTVVQPIEEADDSFNEIVRNVAIGSGVILVCVTVSLATGGTASAVFATAAASAAKYALSSAAISGIAAGIIEGIQTGDYQAALQAGTLAASEGFMWGSIAGTLVGGATELISAARPSSIPTWRQSEQDIAAALGDTSRSQVAYIDGEEVASYLSGTTRPDIVCASADDAFEYTAVEVKNYDLVNNRAQLYSTLRNQITARLNNLPSNFNQEIVLDVRSRGYSTAFLESVRDGIDTYVIDVIDGLDYDVPIGFFTNNGIVLE